MKFCGSGAEVSRATDEIPSTPENIFLENYYTGKSGFIITDPALFNIIKK